MTVGIFSRLLAACAGALLVAAPLHAQQVVDFLPTGVGNWNTAANWADLGFGNNVPAADFDEIARINTGGTAQVLDTPSAVGGIQIRNGRVDVAATGNLAATVGGSSLATGAVAIDPAGTLSVAGTFSAPSLQSSGTVRTVGSAAALSIAGNAGIGGTYVAELKGPTHGAAKVAGNASLSGTFVAQFNGATPAVGATWNVLDAATISGGFGAVTVTGATLGQGQAGALRQIAGGTHGNLLQFAIEQKLVLSVNRGTGEARILNPPTSPATFTIDGYAIQSAVGSLNSAAWNSLDAQGADGNSWFATGSGGSSNQLAELNPTTGATLIASQSRSLGTIYAPNFLTFGQETEDYEFSYRTTDGLQHQGVVVYEGDKQYNNLVLTIDPATGQATLQNESPLPISFDGYTVSSTAGSLRTSWTSLADQGAIGGAWLEANPSTGRVSEVMSSCCTTLNQNEGFELGTLFNTAGARDVKLEFLIAGTTTVFEGVVVYGALPDVIEPGALKADFNSDGVVNNADLTAPGVGFEDRFGGDLDGGDLLQWQREYGLGAAATGAATAVPEPVSVAWAGGAGALGVALRRRR